MIFECEQGLPEDEDQSETRVNNKPRSVTFPSHCCQHKLYQAETVKYDTSHPKGCKSKFDFFLQGGS